MKEVSILIYLEVKNEDESSLSERLTENRFNPNLSGSKKWSCYSNEGNWLPWVVSILIYLEVKNEVALSFLFLLSSYLVSILIYLEVKNEVDWDLNSSDYYSLVSILIYLEVKNEVYSKIENDSGWSKFQS